VRRRPGGPGLSGPGSWPSAKSTALSDRFFTFTDVTAVFLSCTVPTLFRGSPIAA
jgi:hypothetical protein